ncbi:MAG: hypothetical protein DCC68_06840 [Planctomycetota bacterium]|nr:MAG: hypothetical protein DCC68_06840 [Planctomycetota bacterium]
MFRAFLMLLAGTTFCGPRWVCAADLFWNDAVGIQALVSDRDAPVFLYDTFETRGIAVDPAARRLVWSDVLPLGAPFPGGVIRDGGTRGGEFKTLADKLPNPAGAAIDALHGNIYWTDLGDTLTPSAIYMARRDGSDAKQIVRGDWISEIAGIAVDPRGGKLYFSYVNPLLDSLYNGGIGKANLDGSNVEGIVGGLGKPMGVAVDPEGGNVYWADSRKLSPGGGDGQIALSDLNGEHQRLILGGLELPYGVALDFERQHVYWTDFGSGKIQRTSMSGILPYFEDVVTGLPEPTAIAIGGDSSLPLPGDANSDERVNRADAAILAANYGMTGNGVLWSHGDFNADQRVSLADLAILQAHLSAAGTGLSAGGAVSVPEPGSRLLAASLAGFGLAMVLCRRSETRRSRIH